MIKGSAPTHRFTIPATMLALGIAAVEVTYSQRGNIVLVKRGEQCKLVDNVVEVPLTQEDTLLFSESGALNDVKMQLRIRTNSGTVATSNVMYTRVEPSILEGAMA